MAEKRGEKSKYNEEYLGISGFVLGILSILFAGWAGMLIAVVGFFLCLYQQKKNPIKAGRLGMILNIIGFVIGIIFVIVYLKFLIPFIQQLQQTQTFPII